MATYWVRADGNGDDGNAGTSYALAKATIPAGLALIAAKGDKLNIVNDGTHDWPTSETDISSPTGTSYDDPAFTVQGTDEYGNAALTTIAASGADGARYMFRVRITSNPTNYVITQNLLFDATGKAADTNSYDVVRFWGGTQGHTVVRYCGMLGADSGSMAAGPRRLLALSFAASNVDQGGIEYCYIQNSPTFMLGGFGGTALGIFLNDVVYINDSGAPRTGTFLPQGAWASTAANTVEMTHCTIYDDSGSSIMPGIFNYQPGVGTDIGTVNCHSNVVWCNSSGLSTPISPFMQGAVTSTGVTHTGTIGYNVLYGGPDVDASDLSSVGWYQLPWDADDDDSSGDDYWPTDVVSYGVAAATAFKDPTSTYEWQWPNGLSITILMDLRPIANQSAGYGDSTPGALPTGEEVDPGDGGNDFTDDPRYLDVLPIFTTDLKLALNARMSTKKNRVRRHYLRADREGERWREFSTKYLNLATNTTTQVNMGGIETGDILMVISDLDIQVSVGAANQFIPAKVLVLSGGSFDQLWVKNTSTVDEAAVWVGVVD